MTNQETSSVSEESEVSETKVLSEIVAWSADCPEWQRDALRRLCSKDKIEESDLKELLEICKGQQQGEPITVDHIRDPAASNVEVAITKLNNLQNVNALKSGETLSFSKSGLTVIYGDNGAGKSGYARVLKQACRARLPKDDKILPNIYERQRSTPQADVSFRIGSQNQSIVWKQGSPTDPRLTAISVFDSRTAAVHVDETNELAYTPLPLRIMEALAEACKDIKSKLTAEIKSLEKQTPDILKNPTCAPDTAVGKLLAGLSDKTEEARIEELSGLSEMEIERLHTLATDLASDPARTARQLQQQQKQVCETQERLRKLISTVSDQNIASLCQLYDEHSAARDAAALAASELFSDEPLPDVGTDAWRALWAAARTYSNEHGYPDRKFPVTDDDTHCVLCQQELSLQASKRLTRFEEFVLDESQSREAKARRAYEVALSAFHEARIPMRDIRTMTIMLRDTLGSPDAAKRFRHCAVSNAWRLRSMLRSIVCKKGVSYPCIVALPSIEIAAVLQTLETRVSSLLAEKDSSERRTLVIEHNELRDRQWLATIRTDVLDQIKRMKAVTAIKAVQKSTATNKITSLSADLASRLVTDRLRACFAREVARLGIAEQHAVELQHARTAVGIPLFHVRMMSKPDEPVGNILSEGEHRCVALAAFLAELSTVDTSAGIIFDDPVSSLDHTHRDRVAKRLATESLSRQVVIFTHDIAFLMILEDVCRATRSRQAIPITHRVISRGQEAAGYCNTEPPANVLPVDRVVAQMRNHLKNVKIHYERGDQASWRREVRSFSEQLREAWERAVEEAISPVIKRLAKKVETGGLIQLTVFEEQDCHEMRDAYGRCSELLHSQPGELNPRLPLPSSIEEEITCLEEWLVSIRERQSHV